MTVGSGKFWIPCSSGEQDADIVASLSTGVENRTTPSSDGVKGAAEAEAEAEAATRA